MIKNEITLKLYICYYKRNLLSNYVNEIEKKIVLGYLKNKKILIEV